MVNRNVWFSLLCITVVAFVLRIYNFTSSPAGFYIDETSIGYNAWSIVETGKDEHGVSLPLFFEAFGEYKLPVYIYSVVLAQLVLGPVDASVRLPAVIYGTLTVLVVYFLVKELLVLKLKKIASPGFYRDLYDELIPLFTAFLLSINPWHFQFTHAGFEASSGIFFLILGVFVFFRSLRKQSILLSCLSSASFVLALYAYNSARIVVPGLLLILFLTNIRKLTLRLVIPALIVGGLLLLPFIRFALSPQGMARAQQVSIFYQLPQEKWAKTFLKNYLSNMSPVTLFVRGEPTIAHLSPHRMSLVHIIEAPFIVFGLLWLILRQRKIAFFVVGWFLVAIIPPAITTLNPHALRASFAIPALSILSAIGLVICLDSIRYAKIKWLFGGVYVGLLVFLTLGFLLTYHTRYAVDAGPDWQVGIRRASLFVKEKPNKNIFIEESGASRISYLWYLKVHPSLYQRALHKDELGKYTFNAPFESVKNSIGSLYVTRQLIDARLERTIYYPNGNIAYYVYAL